MRGWGRIGKGGGFKAQRTAGVKLQSTVCSEHGMLEDLDEGHCGGNVKSKREGDPK